MEKTAIVNLYQVVRMSHYEPSRFVQDDFDTLRVLSSLRGKSIRDILADEYRYI